MHFFLINLLLLRSHWMPAPGGVVPQPCEPRSTRTRYSGKRSRRWSRRPSAVRRGSAGCASPSRLLKKKPPNNPISSHEHRSIILFDPEAGSQDLFTGNIKPGWRVLICWEVAPGISPSSATPPASHPALSNSCSGAKRLANACARACREAQTSLPSALRSAWWQAGIWVKLQNVSSPE